MIEFVCNDRPILVPPVNGPDTSDPWYCQRTLGLGTPDAVQVKVNDFPSSTVIIVKFAGEEIDGLTGKKFNFKRNKRVR